MKRMGSYFYIQLRRACRLLPSQLLITLLACGCLGFLTVVFMRNSTWTEERTKYEVAIVGDVSDSYLGFGIQAIRLMDDSRFMLEFPDMTEEEARRALTNGTVDAYAKVPEGFVASIVSGENDQKIILVGSEGQRGIVGILSEEMAKVASSLVTCSQSAIYSMQQIVVDNGESAVLWEATDDLNLRYLAMVVNRTDLCGLETLGFSNGLSTEGYYLCSILVFFLQLTGIHYSPFFCRKSRECTELLASKGVGSFRQVVGEYLACICLNLCCLLEIIILLGIVMEKDLLHIQEWQNMGTETLINFFVGLLPVAAMLVALQLLLYELTTGVVSGILLQFVSSIAMGYLGGCFYPANFFPETLTQLGQLLPTGAALRYADGILVGQLRVEACAGVILYMISFIGIAGLIRKYKLQRG